MIDQLSRIHDYILHYNVNDYTIEERCNYLFGRTITVNWELDMIRCQCTILSNEDAFEKMQSKFELTKNLLKSNLK